MKLDTLYEEQDKDKIGLIYFYKNDTLNSVGASIRKNYYNLNSFNHRYDGQNEIYDPYQIYLSYLYQKWPETSSWGKYYPEDSYAKPKIVDFIINTKLENDGSASIRVDYEILEEISDTDMVLHIALIEDGITNTFESGSLGEKLPVCNNILRKMSPDGNGTLLGSFDVGDTGSLLVSIDKSKGAVSNYDNTRLIVFFQSKGTFKIYETARLDQHPFQDYGTWGQTSVHNNAGKECLNNSSFTSNGKQIFFSDPISKTTYIKIYNLSGKCVMLKRIESGISNVSLSKLSKGLYTVALNLNGYEKSKRVLVK